MAAATIRSRVRSGSPSFRRAARADLFGGEGMVAEIEIMRGNLTRILYDATRDGNEYLFNDQIAGLTEDGDAGYCGSPLAGLGTAMALVAAYVLAGELSATPDDHEAAFARYQDEMRDYVKQCQTLPPGGVKGFAPNSALMIRMRNISMTMMTRWPMRALIARQFQKADAITLKDYRS